MDRTKVHIDSTVEISRDSQILSLGSCFAENVGSLLHNQAYDIITNPFGILFNPHSLVKAINSARTATVDDDHYDEYQETHFHYDFHSKTNGKSREGVLNNLESALSQTHERLANADFLFLTFGTSWVWRLLKTDSVIANCHKVPQKEFQKEILELQLMQDEWKECINGLLELNPKLQIIFSVSPVRHTRNGLAEDKRSKARLLLLCEALTETYEQVHYFPAYEIVIDELRDYEYFKGDLIHPTEEAVEMVYEKFTDFAQIKYPD